MASSKVLSIKRFLKKNIVWILLFIAFMAAAQLVTGSICFTKSTTGLPCPGCGLTRATLELFKGNFAQAFHYHPLVFILYPLVIGFFIKWKFFGFKNTKLTAAVIIGIIIVFIVTYIIRMIIYFPHTEPMTYNHNTFLSRFISLFSN